MFAALQQEDPRKALVDLVFWELQHADPSQLRLNFAHWWANGYGRLTWNTSQKRYELAKPDALTWWSFMTHEELVAALDYYMQAYPHKFIKPLDPNFDRSLAAGLRAHFDSRPHLSPDAAADQVEKMTFMAAVLTKDFHYMDEDLFFKFPPKVQRELLKKHRGGTLRILVRYAVTEGTTLRFDESQKELIAGYTDDVLMETFLELVREGGSLADRSVDWSVASRIYRRLRFALQVRGIEPHLAEIQRQTLMSNKPWVIAIVNGVTYVPTKESSRFLSTPRHHEGEIVEVWFSQLPAGETTPDNIVTTPFWQI
jgi:hypothetical protein